METMTDRNNQVQPPAKYARRFSYSGMFNQQEVITYTLFVEDGMSPDEIASLINRPVDDVEQEIHNLASIVAHNAQAMM